MRLIKLTLLVGLLGFLHSLALADAGPVDPSKDPTGALNQLWSAIIEKKYGLAAVVGTMLFVAFARFISPRIHGKFGAWVNSTRVSAVLAFLGGALSAVATKYMSGAPWSPAMVTFGFTAGLGAIGGYNAFWDILFPADKKKSTNGTAASAEDLAKKTPTPPPPVRPGALLPLALISFAAASCAHATPEQKAFGTAYASCMEAKGLAVAPGVANEVWGDLNSGTTQAAIVSQLETLAGKAGTDSVACAAQAWLGAPSPAKAEKNPAGVAAAKTFLSRRAQQASKEPGGDGPSTGAFGA